jgi:hypothetical protein
MGTGQVHRVNSATYNEFREPSRSGLGVGLNRFTLPRQALFNSLLVWYWALLYFQSHTAVVERFSPLYFALILPVVAFVVMNAHHVVSWRCDRVIAPLLFYIALVGGVSLLRADIATAYNSALFTLLIILIFRQKLRISLGLLNGLFLLSIAGAVITYWAGISEFGFRDPRERLLLSARAVRQLASRPQSKPNRDLCPSPVLPCPERQPHVLDRCRDDGGRAGC